MEILLTFFSKFLLILARISGIFFTAPLFSSPVISYPIRAGIILLTSIAVAPIAISSVPTPPQNLIAYTIAISSEVLIGLTIGLLAHLTVSLFAISSEFYAVPMGFAISNVFDPQTQAEQPVVGQLMGLFGLLVFIVIDGPQTILYAVCESFNSVPSLSLSLLPTISSSVLFLFCNIFTTALKIGFPMIAVLFLVNLSLGLLSKAAPLMNIMILGFPITILTGLIMLFFIFPFLYTVSISIFDGLFKDIDRLLLRL
jgi:flagellar biosynthetic protein FliR